LYSQHSILLVTYGYSQQAKTTLDQKSSQVTNTPALSLLGPFVTCEENKVFVNTDPDYHTLKYFRPPNGGKSTNAVPTTRTAKRTTTTCSFRRRQLRESLGYHFVKILCRLRCWYCQVCKCNFRHLFILLVNLVKFFNTRGFWHGQS
jgi:hypothetical protein